MSDKTEFEKLIPDILAIIDRRKGSWRLTSDMEWDETRIILLTHIWQKFHLYDASRPLDNWVNRVVSNAILNLLRDRLFKVARPCVSSDAYGHGCVYNTGGMTCAKTPSGIQCTECPLYASWLKKKGTKHSIATPLSLENHINETHAMPEDSIDIVAAKKILDVEIMTRLNPHEAEIYRLLYIENVPMEKVGKTLKYKTQKNSKVAGYQMLLKFTRRVRAMAREIIAEHELA